jgi:hypothetical protein
VSFFALQTACAVIVAIYLAVRLRRAPRPAAVLARLLALAVAGWVAEDSVIRAYGFYHYAPGWSVFLDRVPLFIVLIWPVVIDSAGQLARRFGGGASLALAASLVLADAALIEPIAVRAGLWSWTEPGLFAVPPIGILGWACFAGAALWVLERAPGLLGRAAVVVVAPLATHLLLLASWWGALRWLNGTVPAPIGVALAWGGAGFLSALSWRIRRQQKVPRFELAVRAPGAALFFVLLALYGRQSVTLVAWSLAFVPPWLALVAPVHEREAAPASWSARRPDAARGACARPPDG